MGVCASTRNHCDCIEMKNKAEDNDQGRDRGNVGDDMLLMYVFVLTPTQGNKVTMSTGEGKNTTMQKAGTKRLLS